MKRRADEPGFTLAEMLISMTGSTLIITALILGAIGFQKSFHASERFAASQADQRRLIDYLARDLRRAIAITMPPPADPVSTGIAGSVIVEDRTTLTLTLPAYYKSNEPADADYDQPLPVVVVSGGGVAYGSKTGPAPGFPVTFRRVFLASEKCVCFVRQEAGSEKIIVRHAEDLHMQITFAPDRKSCGVEVTFRSPYSALRPLVATHDQIMLRNLRID